MGISLDLFPNYILSSFVRVSDRPNPGNPFFPFLRPIPPTCLGHLGSTYLLIAHICLVLEVSALDINEII
jgi:hypothetical protein